MLLARTRARFSIRPPATVLQCVCCLFVFLHRHPTAPARYEYIGGVQYLSCASTHLTAFIATTGGAVRRFSVNAVHPLDDAGSLTVRCLQTAQRVEAFFAEPAVSFAADGRAHRACHAFCARSSFFSELLR